MKSANLDTIKGRVKVYAEKVQNMEMATLERKLKMAAGTMSRQEAGLSMMNLIKISNAFQELSMNWVLTGKGEMIMKGDKYQVNNEGQAGQVAGNVYNMGQVNNIAVETICEEVKSLNRIIDDLRKEKEKYQEAISALQKTNNTLHEENIKQLNIISNITEKLIK